MPANLKSVLTEFERLKGIYSCTLTAFFEHGFGQLRLTISYEQAEKVVLMSIERLSADLESSNEILRIEQSDIVPVLCNTLGMTEEVLFSLVHDRTIGVSEG